MTIGSFEEYVESLSQLSNPFDPTVPTAESDEIRTVAAGLVALGGVDRRSLAAFIQREPDAVPVLGMAVGLTREKLKNVLRHHLGSSGWITLAREHPGSTTCVRRIRSTGCTPLKDWASSVRTSRPQRSGWA